MTRQDNEVAVGAIVEDRGWLENLHGELRGLLAPVFAQARSRFTAFAYIGALLGEQGDRKSCWQLAEAAGHATPRRMQALLAEHAWDWAAAPAALQRFILAAWVTRGVRPIDEFTHQILLDWLDYRRTRWPDTANPHLLINQHSAMGIGPVSTIYFAKTKLRGQAATLERLRVDRQLEEALARGPDPLHLAAVFGLDPKTAFRYAENARLLLTTRAEEQDPASSREPKGQNEP